MKKIGVLSHTAKHGVETVEAEVLNWLEQHGATVFTPVKPYSVTDTAFLCDFIDSIAEECECILVLGGDGTLLSVSRVAGSFHLPLLGLNMGRLGFLAELELGERLYPALSKLLNGEYYVEDRMMLQASVLRDGEELTVQNCLNDTVIQRNYQTAGLLKVSAYVDDRLFQTFHGDGVIVATPTGASGYSLSANGPLVSPEMEAMVITPICAQSLYSRSLVVGADRFIRLDTSAEEGDWFLRFDGKAAPVSLLPQDTVIVRRSSTITQLVRLNGKSFYDVLNEKLKDRH